MKTVRGKLRKALIMYAEDTCFDDPEVQKMTDNQKIAEAQKLLREDWGPGAEHGYAIFDIDGCEFPYGIPILVIQRIDDLVLSYNPCVELYENDVEAAKVAKKDGIKLIPCKEYPYKISPFSAYRFIDTPENRENLKKIVAKELDR